MRAYRWRRDPSFARRDAVNPSKPCPDDNELLDYLEGRGGSATRVRVEEHLDGCSQCGAALADLARWLSAESGAELRAPASTTAADQGPGDPEFLVPGASMGRYTVTGLIGVGAMGAVYCADDPQLQREVAIKVLHGAVPGRNVLPEARSLAQLEHPNVVSIYDVGEQDGRAFIVMERLFGQTLDAWLRLDSRAPDEILRVVISAARGLLAAHRSGLVHRDFKPANVIVAEGDRVVVTDFGLAVEAAAGDSAESDPEPSPGTAQTRPAPAGTPAYMAPEQRRGEPVTPAADQYALCLVLFEALHGHRLEPGAPVDHPHPGLSPRQHRALVRGLQHDPIRRHAGLEPLIDALEGRRRSVIPWAASGLMLAAVGAFAVARWSAPGPCESVTQPAHPFDATARESLRAAFGSSDLPYSPTVLATVERRMDTHASRWRAAHREACRLARGSHASDPAWHRGVQQCLARSGRHAEALLTELEQAGNVTVRRAAEAVHGLSPPMECLEPGSVEDPEASDALEAARAALLLARVRQDVGHLRAALDAIGQAQEAAAALDDARLHGEIAFRNARLLAQTGSPAEARAELERGYWLVVETGDDALTARIATSLVHDAVDTAAPPERRETWSRHARAAVERSGEGRAAWLVARAAVDRIDGQFLMAAVRELAALRLLAARHGIVSVPTGLILHELSVTADLGGSPQLAVLLARAAFGVLEPILGVEHPRFAALGLNLGQCLTQLQRWDEAKQALLRALEVQRVADGREHAGQWVFMVSIAAVDLGRGHLASADAMAAQTEALIRRELGPDAWPLGFVLEIRSQVDARRAPTPAALRRQRRALEHVQTVREPMATAGSLVVRGDLELGLGSVDDALASYREAQDLWRAVLAADDQRLAMVQGRIGEALLLTPKSAEAAPLLESAWSRVDGEEGDPYDQARLAFALARALAADPDAAPRVAGLMATARAALRDHESTGLRLALDAWTPASP